MVCIILITNLKTTHWLWSQDICVHYWS